MMDVIEQKPKTEGSKNTTFDHLPKGIVVFLNETGAISRFAIKFFKQVFSPPFEFREVLRQGFEIGYRSLSLVAITSFIIGLVLCVLCYS